MTERDDQDYERFCAAPDVAALTRALEADEASGRRHLRRYLLIGTLAAIASGFGLALTMNLVGALIAAAATLIIFGAAALWPLLRAGSDFKQPVLEKLAVRRDLTFLADGFSPPVYPEAQPQLFAGANVHSFSDLFWGTDAAGRRFAFYEGRVARRGQKSTHELFRGTFYAFQRAGEASGKTMLRPEGFLSFLGLGQDVRFGDDAFDRSFKVSATDESEARRLFGDDTRRLLLALRGQGSLFAFIDGADVLVAVAGRNRFEPGSMLKRQPPRMRIRAMWDDVTESLHVLNQLKAVLG